MNYALPVVLAAITVFIIFIIVGNNGITVSNYDIAIARLPASFIGYRIVQISDIHNKSFGRTQRRLIYTGSTVKTDAYVFPMAAEGSSENEDYPSNSGLIDDKV